VFPDELLGLSSDRDVEFAIELIPRTPPILRRPYRMFPNKLAELKKQLQDLLTMGLIHLSLSEWGCPALFVKGGQNTRYPIPEPELPEPRPEVPEPKIPDHNFE
jgi:hypothetical protein